MSSQGRAIITTRDRSIVHSFADCAIEVAALDDHTGCDFLLYLLSTDLHNEIGQREAAAELVRELGGHPLAISRMASLIHQRRQSITEFVRMYEKHSNRIHGTSELATIWQVPFNSLKSTSRALLAMLCFLDIDCISQDLFQPFDDSVVDFPERPRFCDDKL